LNLKKNSLFTLLALICWLFASAAKPETDSIPIIRKLVTTNIPADEKLRFLNKLCANYWTVDPDTALLFGWQGLPLLKEKVSAKNAGLLHFVLGMAWENKGNSDSTLWYLNKAKDILQECKDKKFYFRAIEQIGSLYRINGNYDTAIVMMNQALAYFRSTKNDYQIMSTLFNIGSVYLEKNRFNKALEYYLASAKYDSVLKDTTALATHYLGIGNIYSSLGNLFTPFNKERAREYYSLSRRYYLDAGRFFMKTSYTTGLCFTSMGMLSSYVNSGMLKQADSLLVADAGCLNYGDSRVRVGFKISQAQLFLAKGRKPEALAMFQNIAASKSDILILPEFNEALLSLAGLLMEKGYSDSAWRMAERSLNWARKRSVYPLAATAAGMMAGWYEHDGNLAKALALTREAEMYNDSILAEIGKEIFDETEMKFKNQLLQAKVVRLEDEQKIQQFRNLVIAMAAAIAGLILVLVISWLIARSRKALRKQREAEHQWHLAEKEKELTESAMGNLNMAMQLKEQELLYHTLQNADLSVLNRSIREKLMDFQLRFQKKRDQEAFSNVLGEIHRDTRHDPLGEFEVVFRQMHGDFYEKLLTACPDLSKAELQVCALLRLNLSSKDIARLLSLTVASVDVTRSHIRKKLNLDQNQNLSACLMKL
jgi:tetratricopeptide (TPR) repeat protein